MWYHPNNTISKEDFKELIPLKLPKRRDKIEDKKEEDSAQVRSQL